MEKPPYPYENPFRNPHDKTPLNINEHEGELRYRLGATNRAAMVLEALSLVELPRLEAAAITDQHDILPGSLCTQEQWVGFLDAQLAILENNQPQLTAEFILDLGRRFTHYTNPASRQVTLENLPGKRKTELETIAWTFNSTPRLPILYRAVSLQRNLLSTSLFGQHTQHIAHLALNWAFHAHSHPRCPFFEVNQAIWESEDTHLKTVEQGCKTYDFYTKRANMSLGDPAMALGLASQRRFFQARQLASPSPTAPLEEQARFVGAVKGQLGHALAEHRAGLEPVEPYIARLEKELGLHSRLNILTEAALLIDKKFLDAAIILDNPKKPERLFGDEAWAGYLNAKLYLLQHLDEPLTIDLILETHRRLLGRVDPMNAGQLRTAGGLGGQFTNGIFGPVIYTPTQIRAINSHFNPRLSNAQPYTQYTSYYSDPKETSALSGYIHYPGFTKQGMADEIQLLCDWFNTLQRNPRSFYEHRGINTRLQECIAALHPTAGGVGGRLSRLMMDWAFSRRGHPSSAPDNFDDDLLTSFSTWTHHVARGQERHQAILERKRILAHENPRDALSLFELTIERQLYKKDKLHLAPFPALHLENIWYDHVETDTAHQSIRNRLSGLTIDSPYQEIMSESIKHYLKGKLCDCKECQAIRFEQASIAKHGL